MRETITRTAIAQAAIARWRVGGTEKLEHYQRIPGLSAVVLVSHRERCIEVSSRGDDRAWQRSEARAGNAAALPNLDATLVVDEVYRDALTGDWLA